MTEKVNFKDFANNIYSNHEQHEHKIKELFVKSQICSKDAFFEGYQNEIKNIESEITPSKDNLSLNHFKEIFQSFEKYPSNIQKPKKSTPKDLNRTLAACKTNSQSDINSINVNIYRNNTKWDDGPSTCEIYKNFRKFKQSLKKYFEELENKDLEGEYTKSLQKLNTLAKEVEKLYPAERLDIEKAFSEQQIETLRQFVANMERGLFIDSNRNLYKEEDQTIADTENLENVMELLSYWLNSVGQFNEM